MMKRILSLISIALLVSTLIFAQAGPKQKEKSKPKKKKTEEKGELQPGERLLEDKPKPTPHVKPETDPVEVKSEEPKKDAAIISTHLKRAIFTTAIVQREPVDDIDTLSAATERIYFFTEIAGLQDKTIRHRWIYNNEVLAEIPIPIGGPNWRVYSRKKLLPAWTGEWTVVIIDEDDNFLGKKKLVYFTAPPNE
jgi:hypothetical protein